MFENGDAVKANVLSLEQPCIGSNPREPSICNIGRIDVKASKVLERRGALCRREINVEGHMDIVRNVQNIEGVEV